MDLKPKVIQQNKGMTMVEVLIGFVILLLILGMLSGVIAFAHNMFLNAVDIKKSEENLEENAYKKTAAESGNLVAEDIIFRPRSGMPGVQRDITVTTKIYKITNTYQDVDLSLYICKDDDSE